MFRLLISITEIGHHPCLIFSMTGGDKEGEERGKGEVAPTMSDTMVNSCPHCFHEGKV